MFSIDLLRSSITDYKTFDHFLKTNISDVTRYFEGDYLVLKNNRFDFDDFVIESANKIGDLDFNKYYNSLFILTLLDYSERYLLPGSYSILYNIATENKLDVGSRHAAAKLFLLDIIKKNDHVVQFDQIVSHLELAYESEEDDEVTVLATFGNYFLNAVLNTADVDITIVSNILSAITEKKNQYKFLSFPFVSSLLSITPVGNKSYSDSLTKLIIGIVKRRQNANKISDVFVIECGSSYCGAISNIHVSFNSIRAKSREIFNELPAHVITSSRESLLRGVKIIDEEDQLYTYMTLYGAKHQKKLISAFQQLKNLPNEYNIIDWACGQGLATMLFFDYFGLQGVNSLILNEPSKFALSRASLHVKKYSESLVYKTVNNKIEDINPSDIYTNNGCANIHLFSNILDIKLDLNHLTNLIKNSCIGVNYFVCVSPFIDDLRTSRIDFFVNQFSDANGGNFEMIYSEDIRFGNPTMVLRIFKVII